MKQQHRSMAEAIQFVKFRLAAFRSILEAYHSRLATLLEERAVVDRRIEDLEKARVEAPAIIERLERELERLRVDDSRRMAVGGSSRYRPSRAESLVRQRERLLRRLAEVEASLPPELRGGGQ